MTRTIVALATLAVVLSTSTVLASNYPPNYPWAEECQYNGPIKACRSKQGNKVDLRIYYAGDLSSTQHGDVSVYVQFNWQDGPRSVFVPMTDITVADSNQESVLITNGWLSCASTSPSDCQDSPVSMKHLLYWGAYDYRYNGWDFEVAFVGANGVWDSNYGGNYKFHFNAE